jgi:tRNA nucleotidyltransferase/poly(A) polymerase
MAKLRAPAKPLLRKITSHANRLGIHVWLVGGWVRDALLKRRDDNDYDLVSEQDPRPLAEALGGKFESFGQFGTLRLFTGGTRVDFARSRRETYPQPAALPVVEPAPLSEDLFRRDFTINAMAFPLTGGEVLDPHGGLADLKAGVVRVLHDQSFRDDPTRVFRAARFIARFGFKPAPGLPALAKEAREHAERLSPHRIMQELLRILEEDEPAQALDLLRRWGYIDLIHADLRWPGRGETPAERLGAMLIELGKDGPELLRAMPLEHSMATRLREALELHGGRRSPRTAVSEEAVAIVRAALPKLPRKALEPLMLGGADLKSAGLSPGPKYREILDAAAQAQWKGEFSTKPRAKAWLKKALRAK